MLTPHTGSFVVPDASTKLSEVPWVAEWISRPLEDLKSDSRFRHTKDLGPVKARDTELIGGSRIMEKSSEYIDLLEIRDKRNGKVIVCSPGMQSKVHLFEDDDLQFDGRVPYLDLVFNEDEEVFWGVPDAAILEPHQREINEIRTQQMLHRRMALIRILYDVGKIDESEVMKMLGEDVVAAIKCKGDPNSSTKQLEVDIPDALFKFDLQVMSDVRENLGFSRNEFGEMTPPEARTSATEIAVVRAASQIRVDERRDMVADVLVDSVKYFHEMIFRFWRTPQVVDIAGPMGIPIWVTVTPSQLSTAKYNIHVDPDTAVPETRAVRRDQAMKMYAIMSQNPYIDPIKLLMYFVNEMGMPQLDDLMPMFPPLAGSMAEPMTVQQYGMFNQELAKRGIQPSGAAPAAGAAGGTKGAMGAVPKMSRAG